MNKTKIDWQNNKAGWNLDYTWNPVFGCPNRCQYCYAAEINNRFKIIPDFTEMTFFENRLEEPKKVKKPSVIFVGSMSDMGNFGNINPDGLRQVYDVCRECPQHTFLFLSKNPVGLTRVDIPPNVWIGATFTFDPTNRFKEDVRYSNLKNFCTHAHKFASIEPLMGEIKYTFDFCDWVVIGAMTGRKALEPKANWVLDFKHDNIHLKNNIHTFLKTPKL